MLCSATMTFRISTRSEPGREVVCFGGDLTGAAIAALEERLQRPEGTGPRVLDLGEVRYADASGARLLCEVERRGVILQGAPASLRILIERAHRRRVSSARKSG